MRPSTAPSPHEVPTTPLEVAPAPGGVASAQPRPAGSPSLVSAGGEQCPTCGVQMAADQRYCLACGHRRGDPRLPFMDAVVFMDAAKKGPPRAAAPPPPPSAQRPRVSANASLIAGIATLVLAVGVGVLIGRSGENGVSTATGAPQIIKVGGGTETASTATAGEAGGKGKSAKGGASKAAAKAKSETGSSGATKATEEVFKPVDGVQLPPQKVQKGGKCESGTAGCESGEFTGDFFGE